MFPLAHHLQIVHHLAGVGEETGDGFSRIDDAATSRGDYHVTLFAASLLQSPRDQVHRGFTRDGESKALCACSPQVRLEPVPELGRAASDYEYSASPLGCRWRDLLHCTFAENDSCRSGKFK